MTAERFLHNVVFLAGGTAFAQFFLLIAAPLLTRLYTPDDFGIRSIFISILTVLVAGVTGRYHMAILLEKKWVDAINLIAVCLLVMLIFCAAAVFGWWFISSNPELFGIHSDLSYFLLLPVSLLGGGIYLTLSQWAILRNQYVMVTKAKVAQPIGQLAPQLIIGAFFPGPLGLLVGDTIGRWSSAFVLGRWFVRENWGMTLRISFEQMRILALRHSRLPIFSVWGVLFQGVSLHLPVPALAWAFGTSAAGWYSIALLVIQSPFLMLSQAVAQVFYGDAAHASGQKDKGDLALKVFARLIVLGTSPLLLFAVISPDIFPFVFGENWTKAGSYAQALTPYVLSIFVTTHLFNLVFLLGRERADMLFQLSLLMCRLAILIWGITRLQDPLLVITAYSLVNAGLLFAYGFWLLSLAGTAFRRSSILLIREIVLSVLLVAPAAFASDQSVIHPAVAVGLSVLLVGIRLGAGIRDLVQYLPKLGQR